MRACLWSCARGHTAPCPTEGPLWGVGRGPDTAHMTVTRPPFCACVAPKACGGGGSCCSTSRHVVAHDERRGHDGPQRKVRLVLPAGGGCHSRQRHRAAARHVSSRTRGERPPTCRVRACTGNRTWTDRGARRNQERCAQRWTEKHREAEAEAERPRGQEAKRHRCRRRGAGVEVATATAAEACEAPASNTRLGEVGCSVADLQEVGVVPTPRPARSMQHSQR